GRPRRRPTSARVGTCLPPPATVSRRLSPSKDSPQPVAGRTVILITHRPAVPGSVDQVLRLNDGRLLPAAWQPA
ncbi:MAG TPA: hypothetical protein VF223_06215, partial [Trebonia sp.]